MLRGAVTSSFSKSSTTVPAFLVDVSSRSTVITLDGENPDNSYNRPISVDVFIATYSEDVELVRLGIIDAKKITYPHKIDMNQSQKRILESELVRKCLS